MVGWKPNPAQLLETRSVLVVAQRRQLYKPTALLFTVMILSSAQGRQLKHLGGSFSSLYTFWINSSLSALQLRRPEKVAWPEREPPAICDISHLPVVSPAGE